MPSPRKGSAHRSRPGHQLRLPTVRRRSQQSRAEKLGARLQGTGEALVCRAGKASSKGRSKPALAFLASAGAGAVALAVGRRRRTQAAHEPLTPETTAGASDAHDGPPASAPAPQDTSAGESRAPTTEE